MSKTYYIIYQLFFYLLVTSMLLSGCNGPGNMLLPVAEHSEQIQQQAINSQANSEVDVVCMDNQASMSEEGPLVSLYEQDGKVQAEVAINIPPRFNKIYTGVSVCINNETTPARIGKLLKRLQQSVIEKRIAGTKQIQDKYILTREVEIKRKRENDCKKEKPKEKPIVKKGRSMGAEQEQGSSEESLPELPGEIWEHILLYLDVNDVKHACFVNKLFHDIIINNSQNKWLIKEFDFNQLTKGAVSRLHFDHFISEAIDLPEEFWPYLRGSKIEKLIFYDYEIGDEQAIKIAEVLPFTQIHILDLGDMEIGNEGAINIGQALRPSKVHTLDLSENRIGSEGLNNIVQALRFSHIHTLNLGFNIMENAVAIKIAQILPFSHIHTLYLSGNQIDVQGAIAIAKALLSCDIHTLCLSYNEIGVEGATAIAQSLPFSHVHTLDLMKSEIYTEGAIAIAEALPTSHIRSLSLNDNQIEFQGAIAIAKVLPSSKILYDLDLGNNKIGSKGVTAIAQALPSSHIHKLNLTNNQIKDKGAIAIAEALLTSHIHTLYLNSNHLGDEGAIAIAKVLPTSHIHTLSLSTYQMSREIKVLLRKLKEQYPTLELMLES